MSRTEPPHALDAEAAVLGALLIGPAVGVDPFAAVNTAVLTEAAFYNPNHRLIFQAITRVHASSATVDAVSVAEEMREAGTLEQVGGWDTLHRLQNATPSVSNVASYVERIASTRWRREIITAASDVSRAAWEGDTGAIQRALEQLPAPTPPASSSGPKRFVRWSVSDLVAADLSYEWDAIGMLVRPTYGMDSGELKTLKSYFAAARAVGLAAGVPILGRWHVPERRRVLVYVAEGGRIPFTRRLIRVCEAHGVDVHELDGWLEPIFDAGPLDSVEFRDTLRGHLAEYQPALVHLDPLYPFQPATVDTKNVSQMGLMLNEVQRICAAHDATFWITAHMNQSGQGFDLKRIAGAGTGEWGDSWCLLKHREPPDVDAGRFRLGLEIGSRQWGGGSYDVDFNIGRFDADAGTHDGPITFAVHTAGTTQARGVTDDARKRLAARTAVFTTMRKARTPLTKTEIEERSTGASKSHIRAELAVLIDEQQIVEHGIRKPEKGGRDAPLYVLAREAGNA